MGRKAGCAGPAASASPRAQEHLHGYNKTDTEYVRQKKEDYLDGATLVVLVVKYMAVCCDSHVAYHLLWGTTDYLWGNITVGVFIVADGWCAIANTEQTVSGALVSNNQVVLCTGFVCSSYMYTGLPDAFLSNTHSTVGLPPKRVINSVDGVLR